ncbi:MAG: redox-regulated ATPase YchF [Planctomycetota bacterium]
MGFRCGIVGLPNAGKTTVFNAITTAGAAEESFPFSTVEPNRQVVAVPDPRLEALARIYPSERTVPAPFEVVDVAGLVKGSSRGEGLGNRFLGALKDTDALLHVVRCFEDPNVPHAHGAVDPARDVEEVNLELVFKDIETLDNKRNRLAKKAMADREVRAELAHVEKVRAGLERGIPARRQGLSEAERAAVRECALLTLKPVLYIANVKESEPEESSLLRALRGAADGEGASLVVLASRAEAEIGELEPGEREEFLKALGLKESSLTRLIQAGYRLLGLITMYTANPREARAWTLPRGTPAPQAAGKIHTDMERGFIRMEVTPIETLLRLGSEARVRAAGKMRLEGKHYLVEDSDFVIVRFSR